MTLASTPKGAVVRPLREGATWCGRRRHEEVRGLQETDAELRVAGGPQKAVRYRPPLTNLTLPLTRTVFCSHFLYGSLYGGFFVCLYCTLFIT